MANGDGTHGAAAAFDSYQEVAAPKMEHQPSDTVHLMSRIQVGPPVITIHEGRTFMVTTRASEVSPDAEQGLFAEDTRLISRYQLLIDKTPWTQVTAAGVSYFGADYVFLSPRFKSPDGTVEPGKIELRLQRAISEGGAHEDFEITNYSQGEVQFQFSIRLESDCADIFEVKRHQIGQRDINSFWSHDRQELTWNYRREDFERGLVYRINASNSEPHFANGKIHFSIKLGAGERWHACCAIIPVINGKRREPQSGCHEITAGDAMVRKFREQWRESVTRLETPNECVSNTFGQSVHDIGALRLDKRGAPHASPMPAAGIPWFVTIFGRDSLIVALQSVLINPNLAKGTLGHLVKYQAKVRDDWRDAQPGKIVHEMRFGELSHFNETPHGPYYGTADATILYLIVLSEAFRWTGDKSLISGHRDAALKCLEWIDRYGDLDGDGFQEYKTFSKQGYHNMGWKDSGVAVVYPDGSQVEQPIAICELQGLVYDAKSRMAELFEIEGDAERATKLRFEAGELKRRFNETFWMEEEGTYAYALDPKKQPVRTIASNSGQLLLTGIVDSDDKARRVIHRLLEPDMYSGWGIRTLSKKNPAYDPNAYQRGSVWPHDNAWIAAGAKRYGLWEEANKIAKGIFEAAGKFQMYRLPELFAGSERERDGFPVQYLGANIPQAWAAGSIFMLLRAILGIEPDAHANTISLSPTLPDWLSDLTVSNLSFAGQSLSIRFKGKGAASAFEILEGANGIKIARKEGVG